MQYEKALELREEWGDKPCSHPNFEREYYRDRKTDDYVCTVCGRDFTKEEVQQIQKERSKNNENY